MARFMMSGKEALPQTAGQGSDTKRGRAAGGAGLRVVVVLAVPPLTALLWCVPPSTRIETT